MVIRRFLRADLICVAFGAFWLAQGLWAFVAPRSFFDTLATFEPYNRHLFHDIGALEMAIGAGALAAGFVKRPPMVGLVGLATFEVLHLLSHVIDRDLGGRPWFDLPGLAAVAAIGVIALVANRR